MRAIRSALLTSAAHLSKILVGFVLLKLIALYLGAEGLGALGHFMSAVTIMSLVAGGGIGNAIIKYVSEYRNSPKLMLRFISASSSYSLLVCFVILVLGVAYSSYFAVIIFNDASLYWLVILLAVAQFLFAFISMVTGVANGLKETAVFSKIQIIGSVSAFPLVWYCVASYGVQGAAVSLVLVYAMATLPALYYFSTSVFWRRVKIVKLRKTEVMKLLSFTLMLVVSAISFPMVEVILREMLIKTSGYESAGIWQGSIKLASAYLGFFNVFLAYYFMPIISAEIDKAIIARKTIEIMRVVMVLFSLGAVSLYTWRSFFVPLILSDSFKPLEDFIVYQLIGDFFKVSSYVIGFVAVAKAATKIYIAAEILQNIIFLGFVSLMSTFFSGVQVVMVGYAAAYALYFVISLIGFFVYLKTSPVRE